jgi:sugar phosphate isomerase/epimerase
MRWEAEQLEPLRATAGMIEYLVHNYFPPPPDSFVLNLASADPACLERTKAHCRAAVDLCAELGAPFFSVHSGFAFHAQPEDLGRDLTRAPRIGMERAHDIFIESLRGLCGYAATKQIAVAIENNVVAPFNLVDGGNSMLLCATAEQMLSTHRDVACDNLAFLVDVGHVKVTATTLGFSPRRFLDEVATHVAGFHLSDNDGHADTNQLFDADAWFVPALAAFPDAVMVVESYALELPDIQRACAVVDRARQRVVSA